MFLTAKKLYTGFWAVVYNSLLLTFFFYSFFSLISNNKFDPSFSLFLHLYYTKVVFLETIVVVSLIIIIIIIVIICWNIYKRTWYLIDLKCIERMPLSLKYIYPILYIIWGIYYILYTFVNAHRMNYLATNQCRERLLRCGLQDHYQPQTIYFILSLVLVDIFSSWEWTIYKDGSSVHK